MRVPKLEGKRVRDAPTTGRHKLQVATISNKLSASGLGFGGKA